MKRSPKKRGLSKPAPPRKTAAGVRGKTAAATERAGGETRAKTKVRLDIALVERGLLESREKAARLILAGDVIVDGQRVDKAGALVAPGARIELAARPRFVSRGRRQARRTRSTTFAGRAPGARLPSTWAPPPAASPTACCEQGAARVYAVDVGQGQLDAKLRADGRVVVMEKTNARDAADRRLPRAARSRHRRRLLHLAREGAARPCSAC